MKTRVIDCRVSLHPVLLHEVDWVAEGITSSLCVGVKVCVGGTVFSAPGCQNWVTRASPSKVDEKDTTGQLVGDYMIGSSEEEREGA